MLRLDNKYFVPFISVVAFFGFMAIGWFTFSYSVNQHDAFAQTLSQQPEWSHRVFAQGVDSLRVSDLSGQAIIVFWAEWSGQANEALAWLKENASSASVLVASVKEGSQYVERAQAKFPTFQFGEGTDLYGQLKVPGVPSFIFLDENKMYRGHLVGFHPEELAYFVGR